MNVCRREDVVYNTHKKVQRNDLFMENSVNKSFLIF